MPIECETVDRKEMNSRSPQRVMRRFTRQRAVILNVVRSSGHLSADSIYHKAREREPNISLSTVYRSVEAFVKEGLVVQRRFGRSSRRYYEMAKPVDHYHLFCLGCGAIFELPCELNGRIEAYAGEEIGFRVTGIELSIEGYCPACYRIREALNLNNQLRRNGNDSNTAEPIKKGR